MGNKAIMQGIDDPQQIRRLIMERVQRSTSAGLGDERPATDWSEEHLSALRQIAAEVRALG